MTSANPVAISDLHQFCFSAMKRCGADDEDASTIAEALVTADSWGVFTHGTKLLYDYTRRIRAGGIRVDQKPVVAKSGPAFVMVDGHHVMGQVAAAFAMRQAMARAKQTGIGYAGVFNTNHFGAAGYYSWLAAREGMIGISLANDIPSVAAPGSLKAVVGSNPFSYGIPVGTDADPILLDMAISTVAGGKVYAAHQRGEPIPDTWIIGPDGQPTTDGSLYPHGAALQPMSGPKGYGLALLNETLAGILTGAALTWQVGSWIFADPTQPTWHGAAFLAIDVESMLPQSQYEQRIRHVINEIHAAPSREDVEHVLLPGEREWQHRHRAEREGIHLPADVVAKLQLLSQLVDVPLPF